MWILVKVKEAPVFEFYDWTAHRVSRAGAKKICDILNANRYWLGKGEKWRVSYTIGYEKEADYARHQTFRLYKNSVSETNDGEYSLG